MARAESAFTETPDQMVRRVCRELGTKKNIIVLNDEAHHCYRRKPKTTRKSSPARTAAKPRSATKKRASGSPASRPSAKVGVRAIYDLSATPFFLAAPAIPKARSFPWVVSDFSLIDAIEAASSRSRASRCADDSMSGEQPTYRDFGSASAKTCPRRARHGDDGGEPKLPGRTAGRLAQPLRQLRKYYRRWEQNAEARADGITPPVFIVVCNNTNVSKLVFDYIAGWEKRIGGTHDGPGRALAACSATTMGTARWLHRPNTILVDSEQLESGEAMSDDFKKIAAARDRGVQGRVPRPLPRPRRREISPTKTCCAKS